MAQAFGLDIAQRAEVAFQSFWRAERPTLWSRRPLEERNSTPWAWIYGLCGVAAEATSPGWAAKLTPSEAQTAVAYSTVELNGFSSWLVDLVAAQSAEIDSVLGNELIAELAMGAEHQHLPTLQNLTYADTAVKRLLAPRLLEALPIWPPALVDDEQRQRWAHHLDQVITILNEDIQQSGSVDSRF